MSNVSLIMVLEIFSQPDDLAFRISQPDKNGKWCFAITRGPGHRYKILITTKPVFNKAADAIKAISDLLTGICSQAKSELSNSSGPTSQIINPNNESLDDANVLSDEYIERIIGDLTDQEEAYTHRYKTPA